MHIQFLVQHQTGVSHEHESLQTKPCKPYTNISMMFVGKERALPEHSCREEGTMQKKGSSCGGHERE